MIKNRIKRLLRWSQKYTKTDMVYLAYGGFWIVVGRYLGIFISIGVTILLVNTFTPLDYGNYKYILTLVGTFSFLLFGGMSQSVIQSVAKGDEGALGKIVGFRFRWSFIYTSALLLVAGYYFLQENYIIAIPLLAFSFLYPIWTNFHTFAAYLNGKKEFRTLALYNLTIQITGSALVLLALITTKSVIIVLLTYAISQTITNTLLYRKTIKKYRPNDRGGEAALHYGKHLTAMSVMGNIVGYLDNLLLFYFWGPQVLASYAIAKILPDYGTQFLKTPLHLFSPKLSKKTMAEIAPIFYKRVGQALLIGVLIASIYALLIPFIIQLVFPLYKDVIFYSQLLAINVAFALPIAFISSVFFSQKLIFTSYLAGIVPDIIRIILYTILGIWGGISGMVYAFIISKILGFFFKLFLWELEKRKRLGKIKNIF